ncbi:MAG: aspartate/glutamate racemase family protein [Pseudomonadota bacterium]
MASLSNSNRDQTVLGVLMLDTNFPRPVGDIGNPDSFDHPVIYRRLPGAVVSRIVTDEPLPDDLVELFVNHARALEGAGATVISTSCGFLYPLQDRLQAAVSVPVVTSALCLLPALREKTGHDTPIGIVTFDAERLSPHHIPDQGPLVIEGLAHTDHLYRVIADDLAVLDQAQASGNVINAIKRLNSREPGLTAVILECTNLPPYRLSILKNNSFSVLDIRDAIKHLQNTHKM